MNFQKTLKNLEKEALSLSDVLDNTSNDIKQLESSLLSWKTNFPFEMILNEENSSITRSTKNNNKEGSSYLDQFTENFKKAITILSWEPCQISKRYRLFFIIKNENWGWNGQTEEFEETLKLNKEVLFKKYFHETKLEIRLRYSKFLIPFMNGFTKELKKYKDSITTNDSEQS